MSSADDAKSVAARLPGGVPSRGWFGPLTRVLHAGVVLLDSEGGVDFANASALEMLACSELEHFQERWRQVEPLLDSVRRDERAAQPAGLAVDAQVKIDTRRVSLRLEVFQVAEPECSGTLVLVRNRAELKAMEEGLHLASQMRGLNVLSRSVFHDLKAPLNVMVLNLDLLRETLDGGPSSPELVQKQRGYVDVVTRELGRLDRSLSALQSGSLDTSRSRFSLQALLDEIVSLVQPQARKQGIEVSTRLAEAPIELSGHRDRLKQAILNVTLNALEAVLGRGQLRFELTQDGEEAHLQIRDSGPGIPSELIDRLFDMHFSTKEGSASGIGLFVTRSVVQAHGGRIWLESAPGRGTTVHLRLPIAAPDFARA